ncbi:MAG: hypothetical protein HOH33_12520 [Verrucomicrobia bacterium]|nr:hypothetical protein [Verrucomicrobiota bacterium]
MKFTGAYLPIVVLGLLCVIISKAEEPGKIKIETAVKISFKTNVGQFYHLLASPSSSDPNWEEICSHLQGTGDSMDVIIPVEGTNQLFFMLKERAPTRQVKQALDLGTMVQELSAAFEPPFDTASLQTIISYGTITSHYVMIRGWLIQRMEGVESQYTATTDPTQKIELETEIDFLRRALRGIDLER